MAKQLIINADDLGLTRAISDGIFRAHREGVLTSTSFIVSQAASEYAASRLHEFPRLGVGIHLNVCEGKPTSPAAKVPSLVQADGSFLPASEMQSRLNNYRVSAAELEAEFRAQIQEARRLGIKLTHADSHHHMHLYFGAILPFRRALAAEGLPWVRASRIRHWPRGGRVGGPHSGGIARRLAVSAYMEFVDSVVLKRFSSPDCRIEPSPDDDDRTTEAMLASWTKTFATLDRNGVFELVCHPGLPDAARVQHDRIHDKRVAELDLLTREDFRHLLERSGVTLASYATLANGRAKVFN